MTGVFHFRDELRACTRCDLRTIATQVVPWSGPTPSKYLFVGMAPGIKEDVEGAPFVGSAGNLLRSMLREAKFPKDVAFANAVSCYPGRTGKGGDNEPTPSQLLACRSNLTRQIDVIRPQYMFLVGRTAVQAFRPDLELKYVHGRPMFYDGVDLGHVLPHGKPILVWSIYHPAAALRNKKYDQMIREDLANFWAWRRNGERWPDTCYVCEFREVEAYDAWGVGFCELHAQRQGILPLT